MFRTDRDRKQLGSSAPVTLLHCLPPATDDGRHHCIAHSVAASSLVAATLHDEISNIMYVFRFGPVELHTSGECLNYWRHSVLERPKGAITARLERNRLTLFGFGVT